VTVEGACE